MIGPTPISLVLESERRTAGEPFPVYLLESWGTEFPGVVAGVTEAAPGADFSDARTETWSFHGGLEQLAAQLGFQSVAWTRQVHGGEVRPVDPSAVGLFCPGEGDGLYLCRRGILLLVMVADCVPVYLLDSEGDGRALLHAGWRGASTGILARGIAALGEAYGTSPRELRVHLGPVICGECYEVGGEVLQAFGHARQPGGKVDLREELAGQALSLGVPADAVTRSSWCTRCHRDRFHSHRGSQGSAGRMAAFLGSREAN